MTTNIQNNNAQKTYYYVFQSAGESMKRCEDIKEVVAHCESLFENESDSNFSTLNFKQDGTLYLDEWGIVIIKGKALAAKHSVSIEE
jgi:hypothetical protein